MIDLTNELLDQAFGGDDDYDAGGGDAGGGDAGGGGEQSYDTSSNEPAANFDGGDAGGGGTADPGATDYGTGDPGAVEPGAVDDGAGNLGAGDAGQQTPDVPMNDFGTDADFARNQEQQAAAGTPHTPSGDPNDQLASLPMPEMPTQAPHIDPPTPEQLAQGPSAQQRFDAQVDIAQNYQDTASPSQLYQGGRNDCFNVAAINALNAHDPNGMQARVEPTNDPNVMRVFSENRMGDGDSTYVNPWQLQPVGSQRNAEPSYNFIGQDLRGGAVSDDPSLQSIYNATTQRYHPSQPGGDPEDAMRRLGADTYSGAPSEIAQMYRNGDGGAVIGTHPERTLTPEQQQAYQQYNLQPWHAYQVSSVIRNDADGRDYVVLTNPHAPYVDGSPRHPRPIPVEEADRLFAGGTIGRLR